ncbi:unnamed protein product [Blepharisma stoltei]|uniref:Rubisco LSMT substrate-binding domain-containing protein n=1 Tax=Blepharisma stoltei TaxID=1481888 RepID=A0AAU9J199_9CILI|nr:unnamed protein product [Blepharisma stoltei]
MEKGNPFADNVSLSPELRQYFEWAYSKNIRWPKLEYPAIFPPGYKGTRAAEDIHPGETIISVPSDCIFSANLAKRSIVYEKISELSDPFKPYEGYFDELLLVSFLIWEKFKGESSEWHFFIQAQPTDAKVLQDWPIADIKELQDIDLEYDSERSNYLLNYLYTTWEGDLKRTLIFTDEMLTFENFLWGWRLLLTRTFGKLVPSISFVPIAEFLNHNLIETHYYYLSNSEEPDYSARVYNIEDYEDYDDPIYERIATSEISFKLIATIYKDSLLNISQACQEKLEKIIEIAESKDLDRENAKKIKMDWKPPISATIEDSSKSVVIKAGLEEFYVKGSEVYMSYGRYSNRQLLTVYGFSLKNIKYNYATLKIKIEDLASDPRMQDYIIENGFDDVYAFKLYNSIIPIGLFTVIRAFKWRKNMWPEAFLQPTYIKNELEILSDSKKFIKEYLDDFPTTLGEDLNLLEQDLSINKYFAVVYRSEIKKILHNQISIVTTLHEAVSFINKGKSLQDYLNLVKTSENFLEIPSCYPSIENYLTNLNLL